jgi:hypothetical protein
VSPSVIVIVAEPVIEITGGVVSEEVVEVVVPVLVDVLVSVVLVVVPVLELEADKIVRVNSSVID